MTPNQDLERRRALAHRVIHHILRDSHQAEDVCQVVLLKYWQTATRTGSAPSDGYLAQMARRACYSYKRKREFRNAATALPDEIQDVNGKDPANALAEREQARLISRAIDRLPPIYREPTRLRLIEGLSIQQIAEVTNLPTNTVRTQVRRGRNVLQHTLGDEIVGQL